MTLQREKQFNRPLQGWEDRQKTLGNTPRAVLMKGVPDLVNATFDRWHRQVLRLAFTDRSDAGGVSLDIGCGYGRLADEMRTLGFDRVIGVDFSDGFCRAFATRHGSAVRADLAQLPFGLDKLSNAYAVTALMYIDPDRARSALQSLDGSLLRGARVLLLEPGAEFSSLARSVLSKKHNQALTRPGFSNTEFYDDLAPASWHCVATGSNLATTVFLPVLLLLARLPRFYAAVEWVALRIDKAQMIKRARWLGRYAIYRWAIYDIG